MRGYVLATATVLTLALTSAPSASAQPLGTFSWQLQPFCNVVTFSVTQSGGVYTLDGFDTQCGAATRAAAAGLAFLNPDGTIGFGIAIVVSPNGVPLHVDATITLPTVSGTWRDSSGYTGAFVFNPSTATGSPRPLPTPVFPAGLIAGLSALRADGGVVARGGGGVIPAEGAGARLLWHPGKAAIRAGEVSGVAWNDGNVGAHSAAFGHDTQARGTNSTAMGEFTTASGANSTAMGLSTTASGPNSTAMGFGASASGDTSMAMGSGTATGTYSTAMGGGTASGFFSTAMGGKTTASGPFSTAIGGSAIATQDGSVSIGVGTTASGDTSLAMGRFTTASGHYSTAVGSAASTNGMSGAFVYGDNSTIEDVLATASNQFTVRAAGGVRFFTSSDTIAPAPGLQLAPGGSAWITLSDVDSKTDFRDLDGESVLGKLAAMPIREWSYRAQDPAIRHVGPTAQDFHAAFGLGEDPLGISTIDADGIALRAIQALEARTRQLAEDNDRLVRENASLRQDLEAVRTQLVIRR